MKKLLVILAVLLILTGCKEEVVIEEPSIDFAGEIGGQLYTYGEFLHIDLDAIEADSLFLVIGETELPFVEGVNGLTLSDSLNQGFFLPNLEVGEYDFYIKVVNGVETLNYEFADDYNFVFYPIKREGYKKIELIDDQFIVSAIDELPADVYDIVIDPGHGGVDSGTVGKFDGVTYLEEDEVLEFSIALEKELTAAGFKVKMTREVDEYPGNSRDMFGENGRIQMIFEAQPKIVYSIHLNAHPQNRYGYEIFVTNRDGAIGPYIADELATVSEPSNTLYHKAAEGIYQRYLSKEDIQAWQESLAERDEDERYEMFEVLLETNRRVDYYVVVRELGTLATDAYEDGRRPDREANEYRESIYGIEGALIELCYIDSEEDFFRYKDNVSGFVTAVSNSFINYTKAKY
jgi:hypothetical protein